MEVDVLWKGSLKEDDRDAQISVVENIITRQVNGIVLAPLDDAALRRPVMSVLSAIAVCRQSSRLGTFEAGQATL